MLITEKLSITKSGPLTLIAGPCVIESLDSCRMIAHHLVHICSKEGVQLIFKASFDKANRSSIHGFRGPGIDEGLSILETIKKEFNISVTTDIHEPWQAEPVAQVCDILQIPAYLCRQTDLIVQAAKTGKTVNIKKGQFVSPEQMKQCKDKVLSTGNEKIILTERGACFGYNNLIVDMTSIPKMQSLGVLVCFDATHSVQKPGSFGEKSGGDSFYAPLLAKSALAIGADLLFCEVHQDPKNAKSDASLQLSFDQLESHLNEWNQIYRLRCQHATA